MKFTQKEIAKTLGKTQPAISLWFSAKQCPTLATAKILKNKFGFPLEIWGNKEAIDKFLSKQR